MADPDGADNTLGTADDDVRLTSGSSAIDAGCNAEVPEDEFDLDRDGDTFEPLPWDLARGNRFLGTGPTVDMGAYEYLNPGDGLGDPEPPPAGAPAPNPPARPTSPSRTTRWAAGSNESSTQGVPASK